uniref:HAT C-terminal dimerisation domain-containing protein n=1 Tax=Cajanus cajan TaxID=3821 RepID=A0A151RTW5_CAJCA|nr:hypothetical protein KK1_032479 [Cajanus cajan]
MSDAWTDKKQRCITNFLVNSSVGTMFIRSVNGSNFVKIGEKLFELLDYILEDIGEEKVAQAITDNGSNYVLASKMLEAKRRKFSHCIDLMLEDIGKLPNIKKTIQRTISLVGFIYSHSILKVMAPLVKVLRLVDGEKKLAMGPNLQQLAIKILSLTCSSSDCERNWSIFQQIHTKRRNRLDLKKLHDLVYVKYNQALM